MASLRLLRGVGSDPFFTDRPSSRSPCALPAGRARIERQSKARGGKTRTQALPDGFRMVNGKDIVSQGREKEDEVRQLQWQITKELIAESLNPLGLRLENVVLVRRVSDGALAGFGRLRRLTDYAMELSSLLVMKEYRRLGLGREIVRMLLAQHDASEMREIPIYLICVRYREGFYKSFGFRTIDKNQNKEDHDEIPLILKLEVLLGTPIACLAARDRLVIMKYTC